MTIKRNLDSGKRLHEEKLNDSTISNQLSLLEKELRETTEKNKKLELRNQILSLKRELNRGKQYTILANNKLAEGNNTIETITASNLMKIDKEMGPRRGEFLSKSFLYKRTTDSEGNIFEEPSDGRSLKEGDILYVDFGKNRSAESKLGMGDFLSIDIKVITVTDLNGNVRTGKRSIVGNKVGFYDERGYIPVFNDYSIEIPKTQVVTEYLRSSNPEIILSQSEESENIAKDNFIQVAERYEKIGPFGPWEIAERQNFQREAIIIAKEMEEKHGIPWQIIYAQSALETGWGRHAPGNNYFGIKGGNSSLSTQEFINGKMVTIHANFRSYGSMRESFEDYVNLIKRQWPEALRTKNPIEFARKLVENPNKKYATDPNYVAKIAQIVDGYDKLASAKPEQLELIGNTTPDAFISTGTRFLNTPYVWGKDNSNEVDCSGFISMLMRETGVASTGFREVSGGLKRFTRKINGDTITKGDLMFWDGGSDGRTNHVAIILEKNSDGTVKVLDASGPNSGEGKVTTRSVTIEDKHSFGRPRFYSA